MSMEIIRRLPDPDEIRAQFPLPPEMAAVKRKRERKLKRCLPVRMTG